MEDLAVTSIRERRTAAIEGHLRDLEVRRVCVHGLRHTLATLPVGQGVNKKKIGEVLSHSNTGITLSTCVHVTPQTDC